MEKKMYEKPVTEVVDVETESLMIPASMNAVKSDEGFKYGGGGSVPNRTRSRDSWSNGWE